MVGAAAGRGGRLGPAEEGADPGRQLAQRERLRHVVVGAQFQADDLVQLGSPWP